ncbi:putative secreted protein [Klebsiella phage Metamorpho]|nr:putative secreted protein [Klebsiella phage Metamorpho]
MKFIIVTAIVSVLAIGTLVSMADSTESSVEQQKTTVGVNTQGKAGLKINDNICVNFTTGLTEVCF